MITGHCSAYLRLNSTHFSVSGSVSGRIASAGHSGSHTPYDAFVGMDHQHIFPHRNNRRGIPRRSRCIYMRCTADDVCHWLLSHHYKLLLKQRQPIKSGARKTKMRRSFWWTRPPLGVALFNFFLGRLKSYNVCASLAGPRRVPVRQFNDTFGCSVRSKLHPPQRRRFRTVCINAHYEHSTPLAARVRVLKRACQSHLFKRIFGFSNSSLLFQTHKRRGEWIVRIDLFFFLTVWPELNSLALIAAVWFALGLAALLFARLITILAFSTLRTRLGFAPPWEGIENFHFWGFCLGVCRFCFRN